MQRVAGRVSLGVVAVLATAAGAAAATLTDEERQDGPAGPVSAFPAPGTPTALRGTEISLRGVAPGEIGTVTVTGSRSGRHAGSLAAHPDGRGASFVPRRRFRPGERVTVRTGLDVRGASGGDYRFTVARGDFEAGTLTPEKRIPRPRPGTYRSYRSTRLKAPRLHVSRRRPGRSPGYLVLNTGWDEERPRPEGVLIADDRGRPVWFKRRRPMRKMFDMAVQRYRDRPVITYWEGRFARGWGYGTYAVLDESYREIARIRALGGNRADIHDMVLTEEGTALVLSYNLVRRGGPVLDNVIQEIDVASGRLLFEWHSVGNVALRESYDRRERGAPFDYFHLNSVEVGPDGDLLLSARNACALYELDRSTGAVNWRLGGKRSDFRLGEGVRFCRQHDARWTGEGEISLFDNRIAQPSQSGQSRAIRLEVDERARRVRLLRGYKHPRDLAAANKGGARMQANGNLLVAWGAVPVVTEYTRRGQIVFDARFTGANDGSYRAQRADWTGRPRTRPAVAAQRRGDRVAVWASWNGATEVARWEVLGGASAGALEPVGGADRRGFETAISVPAGPRYVAVRALDARGTVLGSSRAVRPD
jgi:Arylsulfotransferase (ASST)